MTTLDTASESIDMVIAEEKENARFNMHRLIAIFKAMDRSDGKVNMDLYDEYQELCAL
jgi:hypothetical protein